MSHADEEALQKSDDERYARWLRSTLEGWSELTDDLTIYTNNKARYYASEGLNRTSLVGTIG